MRIILRRDRGVTLVELLVALVMSALLIAALYRTFLSQQKTYSVQEQVVDMQQNQRVSMMQMTREIRMSGFGSICDCDPPFVFGEGENQKRFDHVINPDSSLPGALTVIYATRELATVEAILPATGQIKVSQITDSLGNTLFDLKDKRYISINGLECREISSIDTAEKWLTVKDGKTVYADTGVPVYGIRAISYMVKDGTLLRDENTSEPSQATHNLKITEFLYRNAGDEITANPDTIKRVMWTSEAKTEQPDPDLKTQGGFRTRELHTSVGIRNPLDMDKH